jgi:transposase
LHVARRKFTLEFKAEAVRHKRAESLTLIETGRKFDLLAKLVQRWEQQHAAGELTQEAGRRSVSSEQAEVARMRSELSRLEMENAI